MKYIVNGRFIICYGILSALLILLKITSVISAPWGIVLFPIWGPVLTLMVLPVVILSIVILFYLARNK